MSEANHKSRGRRVATSKGENASTRTAGIIELKQANYASLPSSSFDPKA
jgi:hypothetical protein